MQLVNSGPVIAIGGGEMRRRETFAIDRAAVELTGKERPGALFLPTASGEPWPYYNAFQRIYGSNLRCKTSVLRILTADPSPQEIEDKILGADLIYIGGGDTAKMLAAWRERGIDQLLLRAHKKGCVLCGLSAGAIAFFDTGYSDSFLPDTGGHQPLSGIGILPMICCPHYNERAHFDDWMRGQSLPAIALTDNAAVLYKNGAIELLVSSDEAQGYILLSTGNGVDKRPMITGEQYALKHILGGK